MPNLEATQQFVNLDSDLAKWGQWGDYLAGSKAIGTDKSGTYGIQIGTNDLGIFYNKKIFAEAGIKTLPTTWAQLLSDSNTIMSKVSGLTYGAIGVGAECSDNWQFLPYIYQQGLNVNDLTNPGVAAAVNFWDELLKDGVANKEIITTCQSTNIPQFVQGKLAMVEDGPWDLPTLAADNFSDWGVFPIPLKQCKRHGVRAARRRGLDHPRDFIRHRGRSLELHRMDPDPADTASVRREAGILLGSPIPMADRGEGRSRHHAVYQRTESTARA